MSTFQDTWNEEEDVPPTVLQSLAAWTLDYAREMHRETGMPFNKCMIYAELLYQALPQEQVMRG